MIGCLRKFDVHNKYVRGLIGGNLSHIGPEKKDSIVFIVQRQILSENCQKRAPCADSRPLRIGTIASRDRFRPMGARQNLAGWERCVLQLEKTGAKPCFFVAFFISSPKNRSSFHTKTVNLYTDQYRQNIGYSHQ